MPGGPTSMKRQEVGRKRRGREAACACTLEVLRKAAWAPLLILAVYLLTARILNLFTAYPDLDIPMHLAGGFAACLFFHRSLQIASRYGSLGAPNRLVRWLLAFSLTCVAAVVWEFAEYSSDRLLGTREQLGLDDTMMDLVLGLTGGLACIAFLRVVPSNGPGAAD